MIQEQQSKRVKRVFYHYEQWEDWKKGMFSGDIDNGLIPLCADLLSSVHLRDAMLEVLKCFPISSDVNLSNYGCNRQAWLGNAACCLVHNASEQVTKVAWRKLSEDQQIKANLIADEVIKQWEVNYVKKPYRN